MSAPIQAQSISSLSDLLANPPRYPRNPTHEIHEPLVLYIVRVPGSRDVFLTPLKPPTKASISIDAVQSSLYFLHVERPEDEELKRSFEATKAAENRNPDTATIQRRPLPTTPYANYPASSRPPTPAKSYPHYQPTPPGSQSLTQAERYAHRGNNLRLNPTENTRTSLISRKPIGARPMPGHVATDSASGSTDLTQTRSIHPTEYGQRRPESAANRLSQPATENGTSLPDPSSRDRSPVRPHLDTSLKRPPQDALRITLIRRDPASSSQWNVGSLALVGSTTKDNTLQHFEIELTSPGYGRFAQNEGSNGRPFNRKTGYMGLPSAEPLPGGRKRSNSSELFSSAASAASRKPRQGYSFLSPWQGICSFSNGIDGRSLRCRHTLPAANPAMPAIAADVAEVRFNLPWAKLRAKDHNRAPGANDRSYSPTSPSPRPSLVHTDHQWRRSLQNFTQKARAQVSKGEASSVRAEREASQRGLAADQKAGREDGRMNLDLGREKAGGGFKGHSAKLGKIVIEDEGLKMCDLVVAACMGVWWQHYSGDVTG